MVPAPPSLPPHQRRSPARWWIAVLVMIVLGLAGLAGYLWVVNGQWQTQNDDLRVQTANLTDQVAGLTADNEALHVTIDEVQANLDGATGKVTALADSSAQARDKSAFLSELTESFSECASVQDRHIAHLRNASRYTASSLAAEGRDVDEYCDGVAQAYRDFLDQATAD